MEVPTLAISRLPLGNPGTKSHLDVGPVGSHRVYYKKEGGGFAQVRAIVNLVSLNCPWLILTPKVFQQCTNQLVVWFCVGPCEWISVCQSSKSHPGPPACPSTPLKCYEPRSVSQLLTLPLFSVWDSHLSPSRSWECIIILHQKCFAKGCSTFRCFPNFHPFMTHHHHGQPITRGWFFTSTNTIDLL